MLKLLLLRMLVASLWGCEEIAELPTRHRHLMLLVDMTLLALLEAAAAVLAVRRRWCPQPGSVVDVQPFRGPSPRTLPEARTKRVGHSTCLSYG